MKNIYFAILSLICFYSHSQFEETEGNEKWEIIGSKKDGSLILKLEGSDFYKFSFRNYQFHDKQIIESIYLNSSDLDISNLYSFLFNSFDLIELTQSSFKIDKYEFKVLKKNNRLNIDIFTTNSNKKIDFHILSINDLNNLFGKY
tara:strand:- start:5445 stop:5879 length:435 start_codon:yes stop_codon:yes gene_type:complete